MSYNCSQANVTNANTPRKNAEVEENLILSPLNTKQMVTSFKNALLSHFLTNNLVKLCIATVLTYNQ